MDYILYTASSEGCHFPTSFDYMHLVAFKKILVFVKLHLFDNKFNVKF